MNRLGNTYPAIVHRLLPTLTVLTDTDDDVDAIITRIEALTMPLRAITNHCERVVLEILLELGQGPVTALVHGLLGTSEIECLDSTAASLQNEYDVSRIVMHFAISTHDSLH